MAPRAIWKGTLKIAALACEVALHTAATTSDRVAFHTINRATGHRVKRVFVDSETEKPVAPEDQVKGYEIARGEFVSLNPDELTNLVPASDKTIRVESFLACRDVDTVYLDRPYYLTPANSSATEVYALICGAMAAEKVAAIAQAILFRRVRTLLVRTHGAGLIASTLNFAYEIRDAKSAFQELPAKRIKGEMLDLAKHIVVTKKGSFNPQDFDDRYEAALDDLIKAKIAGKPLPRKRAPASDNVIDLMAALRESAGAKPATAKKSKSGAAATKARARRSTRTRSKSKATPRRKAG
jgi:DNA end-binding protein Ku